MKEWLAARHRGLFIRSYVVLAGGLLVAAIVLDLGFDALQSRQVRAADPWLVSTFRLMESELAAVPPADRQARAAQLAGTLGLDIRLLEAGDVSGVAGAGAVPHELQDDDGRIHYLWNSPALNGAIRLGPFAPPHESPLVRFLPVLFYGSILLIVGLWLRPLLRDLRTLTNAAQKFATDYREPLNTAKQTTQLTSLATNLDDMSARVSQLIQTQKEMTAALSHEIRTPLARVRFAAAVLEGEVDEQLRDQLRAVNADVQQIDDLISDMLDYARLDHPGLVHILDRGDEAGVPWYAMELVPGTTLRKWAELLSGEESTMADAATISATDLMGGATRATLSGAAAGIGPLGSLAHPEPEERSKPIQGGRLQEVFDLLLQLFHYMRV